MIQVPGAPARLGSVQKQQENRGLVTVQAEKMCQHQPNMVGRAQFKGRARVLVVEDDMRIQKMLRAVLQSEEYEVDSAADGRAALEAIRGDRPDLVILDLMLPDVDGWQVMSQLKRDNTFAGLPVLVLSAVHDLARESTRIGASDFLRKPFGIDALLDKVARLTGGPQAARAALR
jgi:DNA-binding response OmpR family regulator